MNNVICEGKIASSGNEIKDFKVLTGINLLKCLNMQYKWVEEFVKRFEVLCNKYPELTPDEILGQFNLQDQHWNWIGKAQSKDSDEYLWFSLEIDNSIEASAIIYHPKKSRLEDHNIYYVDYLAVAPWNRLVDGFERIYKGLGSILLQSIAKYIDDNLSYEAGFCLHSLPQAAGYYQKIGMDNLGPDKNYYNLNYYEMEKNKAKEFINGAI